jgi:hypothetical protein
MASISDCYRSGPIKLGLWITAEPSSLAVMGWTEMNVKTLTAIAVAMAVGTGAHAANLVTNGGFESDSLNFAHEFGASYIYGQTVTGWTSASTQAFNIWEPSGAVAVGPTDAATRFTAIQSGQYLWKLPATPNTNGGAFVVLDGDSHANGPLTQMINGLVVGKSYALTFDWAAAQLHNRNGDTTEKLVVGFGGDTFTTATLNNPSHGATGWFTVTTHFTATDTSQLLSFLSIGTPDGLPPVALLDGVSLTAVPEPTSWALMILGFFGLGGALRSRRRQALVTA